MNIWFEERKHRSLSDDHMTATMRGCADITDDVSCYEGEPNEEYDIQKCVCDTELCNDGCMCNGATRISQVNKMEFLFWAALFFQYFTSDILILLILS